MTDSVFPQRAEIQIFEDRTGRWVAVLSMNGQTHRISGTRSLAGIAATVIRLVSKLISDFEGGLSDHDYVRRRSWKTNIAENPSVE